MSEESGLWSETTIETVISPFETIDPTAVPDREFLYVDIGSIDNSRQIITQPKWFLGRDAPSRARRVVREGDTLFSTVRPYLKNIAMVPKELSGALTSTGVTVLRPSEKVDPQYLFSWVCSDDFIAAVSKAQDGTMYPAVRDRDVYETRIKLPPLPEQRRIVAKLDGLLARSKTVRHELDHIPMLIQRHKQTLLRAAFRGAESGRATKLPRVPFAEVIESTFYGPRIASNAYVHDGIPTLRTTDISEWGRLEPKSPPQVNVTAHEFEKWRFKDQDLMITRTGATIGKCALYEGSIGPALPSAYLIRIRLHTSKILGRYALLSLLSSDGQRQLLSGRTAVAQPNINARAISAVEITLPPIGVQRRIVSDVDAAFASLDQVAAQHASIEKLLSRLDKTILARVFQGHL